MNAGIQTAIDYLGVAIQNATQRLSELDTVPVDTRARMSYADGNQQYGWNEYRTSLLAQIDKYKTQLEDLYKANQIIEGPFEVVAPASGYGVWNGWY
jgi:hypothetical protein